MRFSKITNKIRHLISKKKKKRSNPQIQFFFPKSITNQIETIIEEQYPNKNHQHLYMKRTSLFQSILTDTRIMFRKFWMKKPGIQDISYWTMLSLTEHATKGHLQIFRGSESKPQVHLLKNSTWKHMRQPKK